MGIGADAGQAAAYLARALLLQGRLEEAEDLVHESDALAGQNPQTAIVVKAVFAEVLSASGEHAEALQIADEAVAIAAGMDILFDHANAVAAQARVRAAAGDAAGAARAATSAAALYEQKGAMVTIEIAAASDEEAQSSEPGVDAGAGLDPPAGAEAAECWNRAERLVRETSDLVFCPDDRSDEWFAHVAEDAVAADKRLAISDRGEGRDEFRRLFGPSIAGPWLDPRTETVAVRGEDLVLIRISLRFEESVDGYDLLVLTRFKAVDEVDRWFLYDVDQLREAMAELDRLHMERLPLAERVHFESSVAMPSLLGTGDIAAVFRFFHPVDFRMIDKRTLGYPELGFDEYLERVDALGDLVGSMELVARRVLHLTPWAILVDYRAVLNPGQADESHQDSLMVTLTDKTMHVVRQVQFDRSDEATAIELAVEHERQFANVPTNAATIVGAHVSARVRPLHPKLSSPFEAAEERRLAARLADPGRLDREAHAFGLLDRRVIAVRGEELALIRAVREDGSVAWSVEEVDGDGRVVDWSLFDDAAEAADALDERFFELDPGSRHPGAEFISALRAIDPERGAASVTDDFVAVDHRGLGFGTLDRDGWLAALVSLDGARPITIVSEHLDRVGDVAMNRVIGLFPEGDGEVVFLTVDLFRGDRMARTELFELDDEPAARARFHELGEADTSSTLATRLVAARRDMWRTGDHEGFRASFHPDFRAEVFRDFAFVRSGDVDDVLTHLQGSAGVGFDLAQRVVATRGDLLVLLRVESRTDDGFTSELLRLQEFHPDGRVIYAASYDAGDLVEALRELDRRHTRDWAVADRYRYEKHVSRRALPGPSRTSGPVEHRAALGLLAPHFASVDHRTLGFGEQDAEALADRVSSGADQMGTDFVEVMESVPVFSDHGFVYRARMTAEVEERSIEIPFAQLTVLADDGQFVEHIERFEFDRLDEAIERFAELTAGRPQRIRNLATEVGRWVNGGVRRASPTAEMAEFVADGVDLTAKPHGFGVTKRRPIAIRGEELALYEVELADGERAWSLEEVSLDGRLVDWELFARAALPSAAVRLDERYFALDPANRQPGSEFSAAFTELDTERLKASVTDDFAQVDHRRLGFPNADLDDLLEAMSRFRGEVAEAVVLVVEHLARSVSAQINRVANVYLDDDASMSFLSVDRFREGRLARVELFDIEDEDAAWARYRELSDDTEPSSTEQLAESTEPDLENRAAVVSRRTLAGLMAGDADAALACFAQAATVSDRRLVGGAIDRAGLEQWIRANATTAPFDAAMTVLAARGSDLVLYGCTLRRLSDDLEWTWLSVRRVNDEGLIDLDLIFDIDDLQDAHDELDRLAWPASSPAERLFLEEMLAGSRLMREYRLEEWADRFHPDFRWIESRAVGFGAVDAEGLRVANQSAADEAVEQVTVFPQWLRNERGVICITYQNDITLASGAQAQYFYPGVAALDLANGGMVLGREFPSDDLAGALAYADELIAERRGRPRLTGAVMVGGVASGRARWNHDGFVELLADDFAATLLDGRTVTRADVAAGDVTPEALGFGSVERTLTASTAVVAVVQVDVGGASFLSVEIEQDGRLAEVVQFAVDELPAALSHAAVAMMATAPPGPAGAIWELLDRFRAAASVRAIDEIASVVTDDVVVVDHRPLSYGSMTRDVWFDLLEQLNEDDFPLSETTGDLVAISGDGSAVAVRSAQFTRGNADWVETAGAYLFRLRGDRIARIEIFPAEDIERVAALVAAEGTAPSSDEQTLAARSIAESARSNRATEAWRLLSEAWAQGDTEEAMRHIRDDMTFEVKRRGVQGVSGGLDTLIENSASWTEVGLEPSFEVLGLLGERHAISALSFATEDGDRSVELVSTVACDEKGRISSIEVYDDVDLRRAIHSATHRVLAEVDDLPSVIRGWYGAQETDADDPVRFETVTDDTVVVDNRAGSLMTLGGTEFRALQIATSAEHAGLATLTEFIEAEGRVGRCRVRRWVDPGRGEPEWDIIGVIVAEPGHIERIEMFGVDQRADAQRRYEELRAERTGGGRQQ